MALRHCVFLFALLVANVQSLYFFLESGQARCFFEDLPKDTLVVGDYMAEELSQSTNRYETHAGINILITVDEIFDNDHRVVSQRGSSQGRFTFTAAESGEHKMCFTPTAGSGGGWLSGGSPIGGIKFQLDLAYGESSVIESSDKTVMQDIASRVKDLNARLRDIGREQTFQREREAEFRDQSETTNARVVRWALIQLVVLGVTCAWQLSHLRAFFIKQKLT